MVRKYRRKDVEAKNEPPSEHNKEKRKTASRLPSKLIAMFWWIATTATFTASIAGLVSLMLKLYMRGVPDFEYALALFAEDGETSMVVYKWKGSKRDLLLREIYKINNGGEFAKNGVDWKFKNTFAMALRKIPKTSRSSSPVLFGGTSEMRFLREEDSKKWNKLMRDLETLFKKNHLKLLPKSVRNVDDFEKALNGWISVNYLSDYMIKGRQPIKAKRDIFTTTNTLGTLDLGRDSFHISYEIPKPVDSIPVHPGFHNNIREITLYGRRYYIYTKSFVCLGIYKFIERYFAYGFEENQHQPDFTAPCFTKQPYQFNTRIYITRCSTTENYKKLSLSQDPKITVTGLSNYDACQESIKKLLIKENCKKTFTHKDLCVDLGTPVRPYNVTFVGFNLFNSEFIERTMIPPGATGGQFEERVKDICDQGSWFLNHYPKEENSHHHIRFCLVMAYIVTLLKENFNLTEEEWIKMRFQKNIDKTNIDWHLGYVLNVTEALPTESPFHDSINLDELLFYGMAYSVLLTISSVFATFALRNSMTLAMRPLDIPLSPDGSEQRVWTTSL